MARKICNQIHCFNYQFGGTYCKAHQFLRTDGKAPKPLERKPLKKRVSEANEQLMLKRNRVNPISKKQVKRINEYRFVRNVYLDENPECEKCGGVANEIHHKLHIRTGKALTETKYFMAICRPCHKFVHDYPKNAIANGWLCSSEERNQYLQNDNNKL